MRKAGNKLVIDALLDTLEPLGDGFPPIPDETPDAVEI